jgi:hypothetical protein
MEQESLRGAVRGELSGSAGHRVVSTLLQVRHAAHRINQSRFMHAMRCDAMRSDLTAAYTFRRWCTIRHACSRCYVALAVHLIGGWLRCRLGACLALQITRRREVTQARAPGTTVAAAAAAGGEGWRECMLRGVYQLASNRGEPAAQKGKPPRRGRGSSSGSLISSSLGGGASSRRSSARAV